MTDRIFLKGLTIHAHHGVLEHEGSVGQRFVIDLELTADLAKAAQSDKLSDTISYAAVAEEAQRAFTERKYKLLEASAEAVARAILAAFPSVVEVAIIVHKPHAPIAVIFDDVGVRLVRRREN
jgi:dihydroneopterin aldolase